MKIIQTLLLFPLILAIGESSFAQVQRTMSFDPNTSLMLREFTAMLVQSEDVIQVEMRMGGHAPGTDTQLVDELQRGDIILMIDGQRATSIKVMREAYEAIPDDAEIKIGVRRGDERFIVRATKGNFPERPGMQMVMNVENDDGTPPVIVAEMGLILSNVEDQIRIQAVMEPLMPEELKSEDLEGFVIISINGETFENSEAVQNFITELEVGQQINLVVESDNERKSISFLKQEARGAVNFSTDG